jgi:hypothetical protein
MPCQDIVNFFVAEPNLFGESSETSRRELNT